MGICGSSNVDEKQRPTEDSGEEKTTFKKLLLLGAGWSGKSTVFKQMKVLYGEGFSEEERTSLRWTIYQNIYQAMKTLCEENKDEKYGKNTPELKEEYEAVRLYEDKGDNVVLDDTLGNQIKKLWADKAIKSTYDHRTDFFFANDEVHYFFNHLDGIMDISYVPTEEDVLRCRWISTGVKREEFKIEGIDCELLDVGGQRSERKKWVRCFENVYIVLFVVAISEYDQVMYEDEDSNRVMDALDLFEDISNSKWFCDTNVVLFLNKVDLFNEKIKVVPLENYFPKFVPPTDGSDLATAGRDYLVNLFKLRNHQDREVICKVTCATDTEQIREVFKQSVDKIVAEQNN